MKGNVVSAVVLPASEGTASIDISGYLPGFILLQQRPTMEQSNEKLSFISILSDPYRADVLAGTLFSTHM
jgi:hypothetical protein